MTEKKKTDGVSDFVFGLKNAVYEVRLAGDGRIFMADISGCDSPDCFEGVFVMANVFKLTFKKGDKVFWNDSEKTCVKTIGKDTFYAGECCEDTEGSVSVTVNVNVIPESGYLDNLNKRM